MHDVDRFQRTHALFAFCVFNKCKVRALDVTVPTVVFYGHTRVARLDGRLPLPLADDLLVKQPTRGFPGKARDQYVVLAHHAAHGEDGALLPRHPRRFAAAADVVVKDAVHAVGLPGAHEAQRVAGELRVVNVADDDV